MSILSAPAAIRTPLVSRIVYGGKPGLSVYWAQPESDHPITHYIVEYKEYTSAEWTSQTIDPTKRTAMVYNLKPGTNYNIRVSAVSDLGSGRSSASNKRTFRGKHTYIHVVFSIYASITIFLSIYVC